MVQLFFVAVLLVSIVVIWRYHKWKVAVRSGRVAHHSQGTPVDPLAVKEAPEKGSFWLVRSIGLKLFRIEMWEE